MEYKLSKGGVIRLSDTTWIPFDTANLDYKEYIGWVADGGVPLPEDPEPLPFLSCSAYQLRKALTKVGLRDSVETAVSNSTDIGLKDWWAYEINFNAGSEHTAYLGTITGMNEWEVCELILLASTL